VLVVDDLADLAQTIASELEAAGLVTEIAMTGPSALRRFAEAPTDVVVTDQRMRSADGLDMLGAIQRMDPAVPVIVMGAFADAASAAEAVRRGAFDHVSKPFPLETMTSLVQRACRQRADTRQPAPAELGPRRLKPEA
jgi:DNA-binding NtrC family response regulator